ncbi:hypothetical protein JAB5_22110 [Janthinobacterium sp. HH103]|uniref:primase-helicase family protein n=2 Tax=unclassified Janthinobacterium TaxID=2610881 RepID=UPI00087362FC|nr:primase-helicase family protein [Janthinobacterium sp. HH103]OEZ78566.1 hypothetical protein JAB5_22110 [Janthinobacterium sp. HH103]
MKFITSLFAKIRAFFDSIAQPAAPVATTTAPHIRALLLHLCNQDAEQATWVARWLAYPLRHPGAKMQTALLVAGSQGAGKSLLFERIVGPMYGNQAQLGGVFPRRTFNGWAIGKRYAVLQDVLVQDLGTGPLKSLIASSNIVVRRAGVPDIAINNHMNLVLMTAYDFQLGLDSRRLALLTPRNPLPVDLAAGVVYEIENGGLVDFHQYLTQELDMGGFDQNAKPYEAIESKAAA